MYGIELTQAEIYQYGITIAVVFVGSCFVATWIAMEIFFSIMKFIYKDRA
jgi:hypothetical protein